ncbi:MAG: hypothetical protein NVSMB68_01820 [Thermoanaerobaculia bacterium]
MIDFVLSITYPSDPSIDDEVQSLLFLSEATGSSSEERNGETIVTSYFDSSDARSAARGLLERTRADLREEDRARLDWLDRYEQSLEPLRIGRSFVVAPDARLIAGDETRHRIVVPQEQAFGTGSHETTALCIEMLERMSLRGKRGLDIGAGSGILAIAMLRLGAAKATAFDNDVDAFGPLRDNCIRNDVRVALFIGSIEALRGGTFDVITMNIVPEVIVPLLPAVVARLGGELILSGILTTRRQDVVIAAEGCGVTLLDQASRGEWWCGRFARNR